MPRPPGLPQVDPADAPAERCADEVRPLTGRATRFGEYALVGCLYVIVTIVMVWPISTLPRLGVGSYGGDALLNTWALAWNNHVQLAGGTLPYFDANIFHPAAAGLARSEHLFGISIFTLPVHALTRNALLAYDVAWLASFPACGLAMFWLCGLVTRSLGARVVGGVLYAFAFFRFEHALHLQLLVGWGLPLTLRLLHDWWHAPAPTRVVPWGGLMLLQCLSSWYLAVLCAVANGLLLAWLAASSLVRARLREAPDEPGGTPSGSSWLWLGATSLVVGLVLLGFARPYLGHPPADVQELAANSASLGGYLSPPRGTVPAMLLARAGIAPRPWTFENSNYLGITAMTLAIVGLITAGTNKEQRGRGLLLFFAALAAASVLLSFGPHLTEGSPRVGWSPFWWLHHLPGLGGFRVPARFALLVTLAVAVLGAAGADAVRRRLGAPVLWAAAALFLVEVAPVRYEIGRPRDVERPEIYARLRQYPPGPLVSLPAFTTTPTDWLEPEYMLFATDHWFPILNGYSRYVPAGHLERMQVIAGFPGEAALAELRRLRVTYVVTHAQRYGVDLRPMIAEARNNPQVSLLASTGKEYLWRIRDAR